MTAESIIATAAFVLVLVALTMQIVALFRRLAKPGSIGSWALLVASVLLVAVLVMRSVRIGFPARNRYHDPIYEKIKSVIGSQSKGKLQCERNEQSR
jgi:tetrahydromethanopterin S-methyltransferase subunit E